MSSEGTRLDDDKPIVKTLVDRESFAILLRGIGNDKALKLAG